MSDYQVVVTKTITAKTNIYIQANSPEEALELVNTFPESYPFPEYFNENDVKLTYTVIEVNLAG
jgi:hypothetical protein